MGIAEDFYNTDPSLNTAPPPNGAPEGMAPSDVNDTMRTMMASQREIADRATVLETTQGGSGSMSLQDKEAVDITGGNITADEANIRIGTPDAPTVPGQRVAIGFNDAASGYDTLTTIRAEAVNSGVLPAAQIPTAGVTVENAQQLGNVPAADLLPIGIIVMWNGNRAQIDASLTWAICDGTRGTPDLRSRFIEGIAVDGDLNSTGGSNITGADGAHDHGAATSGHALSQNELPSHSHASGGLTAASANAPHDHTYEYATNDSGGGSQPRRPNTGPGTTTYSTAQNTLQGGVNSSNAPHTHNISGNTGATGSNQEHTHPISSDGDHVHSFNPPFHGLYFIQRIA